MFVIFFSLIVGGGIFLYTQMGIQSTKPLTYEATPEVDPGLEKVTKDSDNDNLKDWEEALWKTDPNKADTDGDGTQDGEEALTDRDPLKQGPDDALRRAIPTSADRGLVTPGNTTAEQQPSLTTLIGEHIAKGYFAQKKAGATLDSRSIEKMFEPLVNEVYKITNTKERHFDEKSIKIASEGSVSDQAFLKNTDTIIAALFQKYPTVSIGDNSSYAMFTPYIQAYTDTEQQLLKQTVPARYVGAYVDLLNTLYTVKNAITNLANFQDMHDPVMALVFVNRFQQAESDIATAMQKIR